MLWLLAISLFADGATQAENIGTASLAMSISVAVVQVITLLINKRYDARSKEQEEENKRCRERAELQDKRIRKLRKAVRENAELAKQRDDKDRADMLRRVAELEEALSKKKDSTTATHPKLELPEHKEK